MKLIEFIDIGTLSNWIQHGGTDVPDLREPAPGNANSQQTSGNTQQSEQIPLPPNKPPTGSGGGKYIAQNPEKYLKSKRPIGSGQCVELVQQASNAPHTSAWREGDRVLGNTNIPIGTAIATFINGRYLNKPHGNHAAIYMGQDKNGIKVIDQWKGQIPHQRVIRTNNKGAIASNQAELFSVIA